MKKLFLAIGLGVAFAAQAVTPITEQFINGSGLIVSNNVTLTWNQAKLLVFEDNANGGLYNGLPNRAFWSLTSTNLMPSIASNSVSGFFPGTQYWTNQTVPYTNGATGNYGGVPTYPGGYVVNTNLVKPRAWSDVPAWCDGVGGVGIGNITVTVAPGEDSACTNVLTLTFVPVVNGTNYVNLGTPAAAPVEGVDKLTLRVAAQGTSFATARTNIPAAFMTGAKRIRLQTIVSSDASTTVPCKVSFITASGYSGSL